MGGDELTEIRICNHYAARTSGNRSWSHYEHDTNTARGMRHAAVTPILPIEIDCLHRFRNSGRYTRLQPREQLRALLT